MVGYTMSWTIRYTDQNGDEREYTTTADDHHEAINEFENTLDGLRVRIYEFGPEDCVVTVELFDRI